jgi:hypothetical protein
VSHPRISIGLDSSHQQCLLDNLADGNYSGYAGLNTAIEGFDTHVMTPDETKVFFSDDKQYEAQFVYPRVPADAFNQPVIFSATIAGNELHLKAVISTNKQPKYCLTWFGSLVLPTHYIMIDRIEFFTNAEKGFGKGAFHINTQNCLLPNGKSVNCLVKSMLGVSARPGLFLKVKSTNGETYPNIAIFFPDKTNALMHRPVQHGEAFVLSPLGMSLTAAIQEDIISTFKKLVKQSYGKDNGLQIVETNDQPSVIHKLGR